ncbi:MAG: hypothetical protein WCL04_10920 [Verrucomicrobiota bacterium]
MSAAVKATAMMAAGIVVMMVPTIAPGVVMPVVGVMMRVMRGVAAGSLVAAEVKRPPWRRTVPTTPAATTQPLPNHIDKKRYENHKSEQNQHEDEDSHGKVWGGV